MRTSSYKGIVKSGKEVEAESFVPPEQTYIPSPQQNISAHPEQGRPKKAKQGLSGDGRSSGRREQETVFRTSDIMDGAKKEAHEIVERANEMAGSILKEAREQADQLKREALQEGYREGYEKGFQESMDKVKEEQGRVLKSTLQEFRTDMEQALASVEEAKKKCIRQYLDELKDCAVAVAEKVIHISLQSSGQIIKRMILAETERLDKVAWVKIYMEKTDYEMMIQTDADIISELSRLSDNIKFIVMEKEQRGNCIIEMPEEIIDIGVDTQMENIKEILGSVRS